MATTLSSGLMKAVLNSPHLPSIMDGAPTHEAAMKFVGALVRAGADDHLIEDLVNAALPPGYSGNTLDEVAGMIAGARKKGFGDDADDSDPVAGGPATGRRGSAQVALEAVLEEAELFHDFGRRAYLSIRTPAGGRLCFRLGSAAAAHTVRFLYYKKFHRALSVRSLSDVMGMLEARALFEGQRKQVYRRVARVDDRIYIDVGTDDGEVVEITSEGWTILDESPVAFVRDAGMLPLPRPTTGGKITDLADILSVDGDNWVLMVGFLMNCLRGEGPFMCLFVEGQHGSGKSLLSESIKKLIDPNSASRISLTDDKNELMLQASSFYLPVYDNASGMKGDISDTLCLISTGGSVPLRKRYTDEDLYVLAALRPVVINGIGDFATRPDLLERAIPLQLSVPTTRGSESDLAQRVDAKRAGILGALYDAVSLALGTYRNTPAPSRIRMIDAAQWMTAAEPAFGMAPGTFVAILERKQLDVAVERISMEPVVMALEKVLNGGPFLGSMTDLYREVCDGGRNTAGMPQSPSALKKLLNRLKPQLEAIGIHVVAEPRTKDSRPYKIWKDVAPFGQPVPSATTLPPFRHAPAPSTTTAAAASTIETSDSSPPSPIPPCEEDDE
jgi:hypothetical protein